MSAVSALFNIQLKLKSTNVKSVQRSLKKNEINKLFDDGFSDLLGKNLNLLNPQLIMIQTIFFVFLFCEACP